MSKFETFPSCPQQTMVMRQGIHFQGKIEKERRERTYLNSSLQQTLCLTPAIIPMIFFWMSNSLLLSVKFPQR
jgi:hypothetical protein